MKISDQVEAYIELRKELDETRKIFKEHEAEAKQAMGLLEVDILAAADGLGVESFKTAAGTAYQVVKKYTAVQSREDLIKYVESTSDFAVFTNHISKNHILELMDDGMDPQQIGVAYSEERAINIRKN